MGEVKLKGWKMSDRRYDPNASCPKCGNGHVSTAHDFQGGESVMVRQCGRCGWTWNEVPLDVEFRRAALTPKEQK